MQDQPLLDSCNPLVSKEELLDSKCQTAQSDLHCEEAYCESSVILTAFARECRSHFRTNMHGESIYMSKEMSSQMTKNHGGPKINAAIVVLARNKDIDDVLLSVQRLEKRFNSKYLYDYVFLNNGDFNYDFRDRYSLALYSSSEPDLCFPVSSKPQCYSPLHEYVHRLTRGLRRRFSFSPERRQALSTLCAWS